MMADAKKTERNDLILKMKDQQDVIEKQSVVSLIDIDIQLDNIRSLYDSYMLLKYDVFMQKATADNPQQLSACGTLQLFDNLDEEETELQTEISSVENNSNGSSENQLYHEKQEAMEQELFPVAAVEPKEELVVLETELPLQTSNTIVATEIQTEYEQLHIENTATQKEEDTGVAPEIALPAAEPVVEKTPDAAVLLFPEIGLEMNIQNKEPETTHPSFEGTPTPSFDIAEKTEKRYSAPEFTIETAELEQWNDSELKIEEPINSEITGEESADEESEAASSASVKQERIGDMYKNDKPSLNEIVSNFHPDSSIGMKLQHGSISDLMKSIDMNLKFLIVKELFKGNGSTFTEEINRINGFNKLYDAIDYMNKLKDQYKWNMENTAYSELYKLVLRKFAK
jgi:hypothetical protein